MIYKPFYKSKTFWGIMSALIAPTVTQMTGVDVTTGVEFIKKEEDDNHLYRC